MTGAGRGDAACHGRLRRCCGAEGMAISLCAMPAGRGDVSTAAPAQPRARKLALAVLTLRHGTARRAFDGPNLPRSEEKICRKSQSIPVRNRRFLGKKPRPTRPYPTHKRSWPESATPSHQGACPCSLRVGDPASSGGLQTRMEQIAQRVDAPWKWSSSGGKAFCLPWRRKAPFLRKRRPARLTARGKAECLPSRGPPNVREPVYAGVATAPLRLASAPWAWCGRRRKVEMAATASISRNLSQASNSR